MTLEAPLSLAGASLLNRRAAETVHATIAVPWNEGQPETHVGPAALEFRSGKACTGIQDTVCGSFITTMTSNIGTKRMSWTAERVLELRKLWATGASTAEIGRRLGVSKNAVVGKAHRTGLVPRPSPIRPRPATPPPRPVRLARPGRATCKWPFGDPQHDDFHFCSAEALPGKPYCAEHCARAYTRSTRNDEADEAA